MSRDRGMAALIEEAESAGAIYKGKTAKNHHKMVWRGRPIFLPGTPSCSRSVKNARAFLRRAGVPV